MVIKLILLPVLGLIVSIIAFNGINDYAFAALPEPSNKGIKTAENTQGTKNADNQNPKSYINCKWVDGERICTNPHSGRQLP
jgi:hypothetical protein